VIRAALPHLKFYKNKMYGYMSLCSPHVGFILNAGKLTKIGMYVMQKYYKS